MPPAGPRPQSLTCLFRLQAIIGALDEGERGRAAKRACRTNPAASRRAEGVGLMLGRRRTDDAVQLRSGQHHRAAGVPSGSRPNLNRPSTAVFSTKTGTTLQPAACSPAATLARPPRLQQRGPQELRAAPVAGDDVRRGITGQQCCHLFIRPLRQPAGLSPGRELRTGVTLYATPPWSARAMTADTQPPEPGTARDDGRGRLGPTQAAATLTR